MTAQLTHDAFLCGKLHLWQPKHGYRAATDAVLLAAACPAVAGQSVLDLGCGVGAASLCLASRVAGLVQTGLELQDDYAALARRNAAENGVALKVVTGDLTDMPASFKRTMFMLAGMFNFNKASTPAPMLNTFCNCVCSSMKLCGGDHTTAWSASLGVCPGWAACHSQMSTPGNALRKPSSQGSALVLVQQKTIFIKAEFTQA